MMRGNPSPAVIAPAGLVLAALAALLACAKPPPPPAPPAPPAPAAPAAAPAVPAPAETVALWVGTGCGEAEDCAGREVKVTPVGGGSGATGTTGPSGVARFVMSGPASTVARVSWTPDAASGLVVEPVEVRYGPAGQLAAVIVPAREAPPPEPPPPGAVTEPGGTPAIAPPVGRPRAAPKVESIASTRGLPRAAYAGTAKAKTTRDVVVFTSFSGSYLYLENKRYGTVETSGLVVERMPVGTHRFVAKMPPEAPEYLPPVSDVREVVAGKGAQVVRLDFSRAGDPLAAMLKRVEEGGHLTQAEVDQLRRIPRDDPRFGDAASVLVSWYERRKMYGEALAELNAMAGTTRFAGDPEVHFHLAKLRTATGDLDGAGQSLADMERYMNQYRASERNRKTAEMYRLRAQVGQLLWARSRGTKPAHLEGAIRDWKSFLLLSASEAEKQKAREEIEKNEARLKRLGE